MSRWPTKLLGELCAVAGGNAAPQGDQHFKDGTIPFVRMKDLGRYHFTDKLIETDDRLTDTSATANRMKFFEPGCILFPRSGSVTLNHRAILGVRACIVSHIGVLNNVKLEVSSRFLYHYLTTFDMTALSKKTTGVDSIAFADVKRIPIPVPPKKDQERIVKLLDEADELRKLRAQADQRTDALIPALFREMFGDPTLKNSRWPIVPLGEVGVIVTGNTPSRKRSEYFGDFIEWVKTNNIDASRGIVTKAVEGLSQKGVLVGRVVPAGAVLVTCIAGSRDYIGDAAITDRQIAINQQINAILVSSKNNPTFICAMIGRLKGLIQHNATGVMTGIISKSALASIPAISPPVALQNEFAQRVNEIRVMESAQSTSCQRLDDLFQSMLHRAFNGKL